MYRTFICFYLYLYTCIGLLPAEKEDCSCLLCHTVPVLNFSRALEPGVLWKSVTKLVPYCVVDPVCED